MKGYPSLSDPASEDDDDELAKLIIPAILSNAPHEGIEH